MLVDLVRVTTADGVRLDGGLQTPADPPRSELSCQAALLVHGTGGSLGTRSGAATLILGATS